MPLYWGTAGGTAPCMLPLGTAVTSTSGTMVGTSYWVQDSQGQIYQAMMANAYANQTATASGLQHAMLAQQYQALAATQSHWPIWEDCVTPTEYYNLAQQRAVVYRRRTAEEIERARLREEERQRQYAEATRRQAQAVMRSKELLLANLTEEQRRTFTVNKWFVVQGGKTKTKYRIHDAGHAGNIDIMKGERVTHRLCAHCDHSIPTYDNMLSQKIMLQWDEENFLRIANKTAVAA